MSPNLSCGEVVREIWDWLDREQDRERWEQIESHLATCTGCTEHVDFARRFLKKVHDAPPTGDLTALKARVRDALSKAS
jgi:anti-sigma factor (TIGR02949 family)